MSTSTVPAVNVLIWLSVKPMIKIASPALAGFCLTRAGYFPVAASRGASQIILLITLPSLLFAKIVPSFTSDNINAMGPIVLVAMFYIIMSFVFGLIIRWGILVASAWSNWGDLPTAFVSTITLSAPFNGTEDSNLSIAYVAIFILVFYVTLFPLRGIALIEFDYTRPPKELTDEEAGNKAQWWQLEEMKTRARALPTLVKRPGHKRTATDDVPKLEGEAETITASDLPAFADLQRQRSSHQPSLRRIATIQEVAGAVAAPAIKETGRHNRRLSEANERNKLDLETRMRLGTIAASRATSVFSGDDEVTDAGTEDMLEARKKATSGSGPPVLRNEDNGPPAVKAMHIRVLLGLWSFAKSLITPPTLSLILGILCALVQPLKSLFVVVEGSTFNPTAPDGDPPLAIVLDTATFLGGANVPLGLLVLGAALARLRIPRPINKLPIASIISVALCKLALLPIIGFFFVDALTKHTGLVSQDSRVLRFVLVYFSCVPTSTTQVALTQIYCPENVESNEDIVASYLVVQYAVFTISSVVLTALTLKSIF
ncbi:auxin efflux carrier transmembrane protein [Pseudohyphozyma bogoriensis]|nr:auxin efflux carrier transmembrane protein [Pseudohyphozyma bogoriensis]